MPTSALAIALLAWVLSPQASAQSYVQRFQQGVAALDAGEVDVAKERFRACLEHGPENPTVAFYLACVAARSGEPDEAVEWTRRAIEWGYVDAAMLTWEPDLAAIRDRLDFEELVERARVVRSGIEAARIEWEREFGAPHLSADRARIVTTGFKKGYVWDAPSGELIATLEPPEGESLYKAFLTSDGSRVLTTGNRTRVWDVRGGRMLHALEAEGLLTDIRFSADAAVVTGRIAPDRDGAWDMATGAALVHTQRARRVIARSSDGERELRVTDSWDAVLALIDTDSGLSLQTHEYYGDLPVRGSFSADGSMAMVYASGSSSVLMMDGRDGRELYRLATDGSNVSAAVLIDDPAQIVVGDEGGLLHLWDTDTGEGVRKWRGHLGPVRALAANAADRLTTLGPGGVLRLWKRSTGRLVWELPGTSEPLRQRPIVARIRDGTVEIRDAALGSAVAALSDFTVGIGRPALHPKGTHAAVPCRDGSLRIVRLRDGRTERAFQAGAGSVVSATYGPEGRRVMYMTGSVWLWDLQTDEHRFVAEPAQAARLSPDGKRVLVSQDGRSRMIELDSGKESPCSGFRAWCPDGTAFVAVEDEDQLVMRDANTLELVRPAYELPHPCRAVEFSPDGGYLAINDSGSSVHLLDADTLERVASFSHDDEDYWGELRIGSVAFSPDGARVVTTSSSFWSVRCWDVATGRRLWSYEALSGGSWKSGAVFSADGSRVYVSYTTRDDPRVLDAMTGVRISQRLEHASDVPRRSVQETADGRFLIAQGISTLDVLDADTLELLFRRAEFRDLVSLRHSAVGYVDGPVEAVARGRVRSGTSGYPLEAYAARLFDPKKVRTQAAGIWLPAPELPPLPVIELVTGGRRQRTAEPSFTIMARATHAEPLHRFELALDGVAIDAKALEEATVRSAQGELALEWTLHGAPGSESTLRIDAVARDGLRSPHTYVTVGFE
jgi:WD40 repeat protein